MFLAFLEKKLRKKEDFSKCIDVNVNFYVEADPVG